LNCIKIQPPERRGCVKNELTKHFNLFIGDTDKKMFEEFTQKYPKPKTSKVILTLIRNQMKGDFYGNA